MLTLCPGQPMQQQQQEEEYDSHNAKSVIQADIVSQDEWQWQGYIYRTDHSWRLCGPGAYEEE